MSKNLVHWYILNAKLNMHKWNKKIHWGRIFNHVKIIEILCAWDSEVMNDGWRLKLKKLKLFAVLVKRLQLTELIINNTQTNIIPIVSFIYYLSVCLSDLSKMLELCASLPCSKSSSFVKLNSNSTLFWVSHNLFPF